MYVVRAGEWFQEYAYIDIDSPTSEATCEAREAVDGLDRVWARPTFADSDAACLVLPAAPDCRQVGWTRVNHLGNSRTGVPLNYTWRLPYFPSGNSKLVVLRIRYAHVHCTYTYMYMYIQVIVRVHVYTCIYKLSCVYGVYA